GGARMTQEEIDGGKALRAIGIEAIEGAGADEALELPAVEALHIEAAREIEQVLERAVGLALGEDLAHGRRAHAFDRRERIADRRAVFRRLNRELDLRAVDVGRQHLDAEARAFLAEHVE